MDLLAAWAMKNISQGLKRVSLTLGKLYCINSTNTFCISAILSRLNRANQTLKGLTSSTPRTLHHFRVPH